MCVLPNWPGWLGRQRFGNNERMQQKTRFRDCIIYYWTHKEPSTKYSRKKAEYRFLRQTKPHFLQKCNRESRSSVERMADGEEEAQGVHSAHRMEGHVPRYPNRKDLRWDHACQWLQIDDKENHWSLECQQDRCGALDPFQACPEGRRAHACSSRRSWGLNVSLSWVRTPKEGPGYNWPAIPFRWREMKGKQKWEWNPNLKFSQASIHSCRPHHQDTTLS